jgi:hypothetical protein
MSKTIVSVGYTEFVMDIADGVALMEIMGRAERYKAKHDYNTNPTTTAYYIWDQEAGDTTRIELKLLPDTVYRVAKLAGKPQE